jgi:hypothetical protein
MEKPALIAALLRRFMSVTLALCIAGCAGPGARQSNSGPPEAVVLGATKKQVIDMLVRFKLERRMQVKDVSDYGFVAVGRLENNMTASMLFGSRYDSVPAIRFHYNVVDVEGGVKVFVRSEIVTNPGSAFERVSDLTGGLGPEIRRELEDVQANFAATTPKK